MPASVGFGAQSAIWIVSLRVPEVRGRAATSERSGWVFSDALKPLIVGSPDEPECGDEGRESGGLLLASRVVQEEAGERWTPILEHADQRSTLEVFGDAIFRDPRETRSVKRSLNHEINIIEQERAIDGDRERLVALVELPFVDTFAAVPEADAPMVQHVSRRRRLRV